MPAGADRPVRHRRRRCWRSASRSSNAWPRWSSAASTSSAPRSRRSSRSSPTTSACATRSASRNGTDAITIALRALGVRPGDEVVVPSFTFYASAEAIVNAGARPVFCDVDPDDAQRHRSTRCGPCSPRARRRSSRSTCSASRRPRPSFASSGVPVLEDAAQAAGASLDGRRAGSLGDVGHVLVLSVQEPGVLRRRRRDHHRRRRGRRARARAPLPRLAGQADVRVRRLQLAPGRAPGGDSARHAARARRLVATAVAPRREAYAEAGIERYVTPPGRARRRRGRLASVRGHPPTRRRADRGPRRARRPGSRVLPHAAAQQQPAMAPYAPPAGLAARHR